VLRACGDLLNPGGRLAFYTIYIPSGLPPDVYERAKEAGPRAAATPEDHQSMLRSGGFVKVREIDVTAQYLATIRALLASRQRHARALRREAGVEEYERRVSENREAAAAVEAGLLHRSLFLASRAR
jgi:hypothetical protein